MEITKLIRQWTVGARFIAPTAIMKFTDQSRSCHAERSEASLCPSRETFRCAEASQNIPDLGC